MGSWYSYAHRIRRLVLKRNFALLAGIEPDQMREWFLAVYADASEWVAVPNTVGMSELADGGIIASKPCVSSGNYINRMSDYCRNCSDPAKEKQAGDTCPFKLLGRHFLDRHTDRFQNNPGMGNMYRTWDRMDQARRQAVLQSAGAFLAKLEAGDPV